MFWKNKRIHVPNTHTINKYVCSGEFLMENKSSVVKYTQTGRNNITVLNDVDVSKKY